MTELLEQALLAVRTMPAAAQDDIARAVLRLAEGDDATPPVTLSPEENAAIAASKAAAARGEFATDADEQAVWGKTRLVKLRYTRPAIADLGAILDYVAAESPQGARRVQSRIKAIIDLLVLHPHLGTRTDDPTIRRMTVLPYAFLIFYEPTETEIIIHAVRHARRDPSGMPGASR